MYYLYKIYGIAHIMGNAVLCCIVWSFHKFYKTFVCYLWHKGDWENSQLWVFLYVLEHVFIEE